MDLLLALGPTIVGTGGLWVYIAKSNKEHIGRLYRKIERLDGRLDALETEVAKVVTYLKATNGKGL